MTQQFPDIDDWSREGRAALVHARRQVLREMLYESFEHFAEQYGERPFLDAFRFETLDDAVDWCLERFVTGQFDGTRMTKTWKIFTQPRFWLAQRESLLGFQRKMEALERLRRAPSGERLVATAASTSVGPSEAAEVSRLSSRLTATLRLLRDRTHAALVLWWLNATDSLRESWFDPPVEKPVEHDRMSKKARSLAGHDALFRFQCLHRALVHEGGDAGAAHAVVREWLFKPCPGTPPYRRADAEVLASLEDGSTLRTRALQALKREGVAALLDELINAVPAGLEPADLEAAFEARLLECSLTKTTLTAFNLDEGAMPALSQRIEVLSQGMPLRSEP
ncbi:hypothetical protein HMI49_15625 [Corallococcus exercitus]|uniref:Uncharacterized protein n=1 Tax=Corallococcus exercitus TaxID=2316736 RepID=A0A7Y4KIV7_9BACT|nr:hypothetical protein [Corallococcus exercitus]NOK34631.1 hypothetical protein [Corallococcus exercitus]